MNSVKLIDDSTIKKSPFFRRHFTHFATYGIEPFLNIHEVV